MNADSIIQRLGLIPHPEGGHYREVYRAPLEVGASRGSVTSIYFLLQAGEVSRWHRVDAVEIWNFHAGDNLELKMATEEGEETYLLGTDISGGARPQAIVPPHAWQSARSLGPWSLVGCAVAPAFEFEGFELAPEDWKPSNHQGGTPDHE